MLTQVFGYSALGCVVASVIVGLAATWFDNFIPHVYLQKTFTTLGILLVGSVVAAVVSYFFVH